MSARDAIQKVRSIDGWLSNNEAAVLYELASHANGPIVEIGSWRGRSTAALALGSMDGNRQTVYAVDSFVGVPPGDRPSAQGECPGWNSSSAEQLRANLDAVGVNGLVRILAKTSEDAAAEIPECGVLFVDGAHDYASVRRDLDLYAPKVKRNGFIAIHDCASSDPEVIQAVDEILTADRDHWRPRYRADSMMVFERRETIRHTVMLGFPGGSLCYGAAKGLREATLGCHDIIEEQSGMGWDDMARLWAYALNQSRAGKVTHFAMLHSDVTPSPGWVDLLLDELDDRQADLISATVALKSEQGLTSCGIGDAADPWSPFRRFTTTELMELPETFGIEDTPHPDKYLLHNTGCWAADLRNPLWRTTTNGVLLCNFAFPIRAVVDADTGAFIHQRESEDWYFSRMVALLGLKTCVTRRVSTIHFGQKGFRNDYAWGTLKNGDDATRHKWASRTEGIEK